MTSQNPNVKIQCFARNPNFATGFTVLEMIVVVAIAAAILTGTLIMFQNVRARGRDVTREQHMKAIQSALSLYANTTGIYPAYDGVLTGSDAVSVALVSNNAISAVPRDPLDIDGYRYQYMSADGTTYVLQYYLETDAIAGKSSGLQQVRP